MISRGREAESGFTTLFLKIIPVKSTGLLEQSSESQQWLRAGDMEGGRLRNAPLLVRVNLALFKITDCRYVLTGGNRR